MRSVPMIRSFVAVTVYLVAVAACDSEDGAVILIRFPPLGVDAGGGAPQGSAAASGTGGAEVCTIREKVCAGECVFKDATFTGCASESCEPCTTAHAVPVCDGESCVIGACVGQWRDCNDSSADGCESDRMTDPLNCGECGRDCPTGAACVAGSCI